MSGTAVGRTVFVLGKQIHGNRQVVIVEDGEEYGFEYAAIENIITAYTAQTARFPYDLPA
jgi:hypothetical protein